MAKTIAPRQVTDVKRHATKILSELRRDRQPMMITEHGRATAVLLDVESYERMCSRIALLEGIARGERAFAEGRTVTHAEAEKRLGKWTVRSR